jgi:hypothetical protein
MVVKSENGKSAKAEVQRKADQSCCRLGRIVREEMNRDEHFAG